jgi:hypothetical protein
VSAHALTGKYQFAVTSYGYSGMRRMSGLAQMEV